MALKVQNLQRKMTIFGIWLGILFSIWLMFQGRTIEDMFRREKIPFEWPNVYVSKLQPNHESKLQPNHESKLQPNHESKLHPNHEWNPDIDVPLIYFVTPSKVRSEQKADLTRLSYTLRLVPRLHWILIEDITDKSDMVRDLLANSKMAYTHLAVKTTDRNDTAAMSKRAHPRGVDQRNAGLDWIAEHGEYPSVFYPGDDDNTYDLRLFEEMRYIKKVGVWPVGLIANAKYETPIVINGKVVDWAGIFGKARKFPIDMAGFAVNNELLKRPNPPRFRSDLKAGFMETNFLEQLNITIGDLEPKADNCTKVLVWHTKTVSSNMKSDPSLRKQMDKYHLKSLEV